MSDIYYPPTDGGDAEEPRPAIALPERLSDPTPGQGVYRIAPTPTADPTLQGALPTAGAAGAGTPPPGVGWATETPATPAGPPNHTRRNVALVGALAVAVAAAGVGIGHAVWAPSSTPASATPAPATQTPATQTPSGSQGSSGSSGFGGSGSSGFGSGGSGSSGFGSGGSGFGSGSSGSSSSGGSSSSAAGGPSDIAAIASGVDPGLVDINTTLSYQGEQAAGTGMVLTSSGEVLTNNHVIDGATSISVTDIGNGKTYSASVVGYDKSHDIAVLQLKNASGLKTVTIGNSSNVAVGQAVVGIGNAGGSGGTPSTAGGSVTALNQSITASDEGDGTSEQLTGLIETNADIQAGDSGGSLVNVSGQVIGIDTAASEGTSFSSSANQGFAIPINTAMTIAKAIEAGNGSSTIHIGTTAFLGVEISSSSASSGAGDGSGFGGSDGSGFGFGNEGSDGSGSTSTTQGASVAGTVSGGPAAKAGIEQGDTITSLGGTSITSANDLTQAMSTHKPGDSVKVTWVDASGNQQTGTVTLSSGPPA